MSDHLTLTSHPAWTKFQSVPPGMSFFFEPDFDPSTTTCDKLQFIMKHFGLKAPLRNSSVKKQELMANFKKELIPIIWPFIREPDPQTVNAIAVDKTDRPKLNLEDESTTKKVLYEELKMLVPSLRGTASMDRTELARLYRSSVSLEQPGSAGDALTLASSSTKNHANSMNARYITKPSIWRHEELLRKRRDDI